jgi:hypothetical protein
MEEDSVSSAMRVLGMKKGWEYLTSCLVNTGAL